MTCPTCHGTGWAPLLPIGGAHPDTWRVYDLAYDLRLFFIGSVAIMASDPDSAWRMLAEAGG